MLIHIRNMIFDLDETLYPKGKNYSKLARERFGSFFKIPGLSGFDRDVSEEYERHGDAFLRKHDWFDWEKFLTYLCEHDVSDIDYNHELREQLIKLPHKKIIHTNSNLKHTTDVLRQLRIHDIIDNIFTGKEAGRFYKPEVESYLSLINYYNIEPKETVMFEDKAYNLEVAKNLGMRTVLITEDNVSYSYCDYIVKDINQALNIFLEK